MRAERFGAIAELTSPRALVFVDRAFARRLGAASGAWASDPEGDGDLGGRPLSAPIEAHLQLTNRCDAGCQGCYTGATPQGAPGEWGLEDWKRAIDHLAERGVFHLALGGGESAILPWLGEVAAHARARGLTPNLTTSGLAGLDNLLPIAHLFGQINVSMDGVGPAYAAVRGTDRFAEADRAIRLLRSRKREVGINVVVTRLNFADLDEIIRYARRRRLNEVELLRFKPAGRGAAAFAGLTCSDAQHRAFWPRVARAARRYRVRIRVDCSYTPMLVHHRLDRRLLERLAVYGCIAGDFLVGARANGALSACSFAPPAPGRPRLDDLGAYWEQEGAFGPFRAWRAADEPCRSCEYLTLCRGGCKAVALHVEGGRSSSRPGVPARGRFPAGSTRSHPASGCDIDRSHMKTVMVISDATGETAERMVRAAVLQFSNVPVNVRVYSQVRLESEVEKIIERAAESRALVVFTIVNPDERDLIWRLVERYNVETVDLIGALMGKLATFLSSEPSGVPGLLYTIGEDYFRRIEAVEFAVKNDDGAEPRNLPKADLVLVGISRTSKTPLSTYLAQKGLKVANVPLVLGVDPPAELEQVDQNKVYGLIIRPESLERIRKARLTHLGMPPDSSYGTRRHIEEELDYSRAVFRAHANWPVIDVTSKAIEETAADILRIYKERLGVP